MEKTEWWTENPPTKATAQAIREPLRLQNPVPRTAVGVPLAVTTVVEDGGLEPGTNADPVSQEPRIDPGNDVVRTGHSAPYNRGAKQEGDGGVLLRDRPGMYFSLSRELATITRVA